MREGTKIARLWVLGSLIGLLIMISVLLPENINLPSVIAGKITSDRVGDMRPLTPSEVAGLSDWLAQHRSGWSRRMIMTSSPEATVYISLDTALEHGAVTVDLWAGSKYPGWNGVVIFKSPTQDLVQTFDDRELAPILGLVGG
jgi:hypothetical protein